MVSWKKMYMECASELEHYKEVFESRTAFLREIVGGAIRDVIESELEAWVEVVLNILYDDLPKMFEEAVNEAVKGEVDEDALDSAADLFINKFEEFVAGELASRLEEVIVPVAEEIVERLAKRGFVDEVVAKLLKDQSMKRLVNELYRECRKAVEE
jgi:uncharacterized membrane protein YheB (UPF0754 family)